MDDLPVSPDDETTRPLADEDESDGGEGYAAQLRRYAAEFRRGFLYEVLRWGNDNLLHGGTFQRLVRRACAEFAREGPAGADGASLIFEELFRSQRLDRLLGPIGGEDETIHLDPARLLEAFGEALVANDVVDPRYYGRRRSARLVVAFLRTLERELTADGYLAERFNLEFDLFLGERRLPKDRKPRRR